VPHTGPITDVIHREERCLRLPLTPPPYGCRLRDADAVHVGELIMAHTPRVVCLDVSHNHIANLDVLAPLLATLTNMVVRESTPLLSPHGSNGSCDIFLPLLPLLPPTQG
jgi:hypothetical protein